MSTSPSETEKVNAENKSRIIDILGTIDAKLVKVGRGSAYDISHENEFARSRFTRATTVLGVIAKPQLEAWKVKQAVENFRGALSTHIGETIKVDEAWLDKVTQEAKDHPAKVAGEAADIGTAVHNLIEAHLKNADLEAILATAPAEAIPAYEMWLMWKNNTKLDLALSEVTVYDRELGVAGTFDCLAFDESGWPIVLDWKTSKGVYSSFAYQTAFYAKAIERITGVWVPEARAVHVTAEGVTEHKVENLDHAFEVFEAAVRIRQGEKEKWFDVY